MFESIIPLYGFQSDAEELFLGRGVMIRKFPDDSVDAFRGIDDFAMFLDLFRPDYLYRFQLPITPGIRAKLDAGKASLTAVEKIALQMMIECQDSLATLRLFKANKLRCGQMWTFRCETERDGLENKWDIQCVARVSLGQTTLESVQSNNFYFRTPRPDDFYSLSSTDLSSYQSFRSSLKKLRELTRDNQQLGLALGRFEACSEIKNPSDEVVDLFTCLEALLLEQEEGLSFRLALRAANLIGDPAESRSLLYKKLRDLYALRSKIVHGGRLNSKQLERFAEVPALREIVRRVLLAVLSVATEIPMGRAFYSALDEMGLDENRRRRLQGLAMRHLVVPIGILQQ